MTWLVAMIRSGEELAFAGWLRGRGETVYLPTCKRKIRVRGKASKRTVAAWPGYALVRDPKPIQDRRFYRWCRTGDQVDTMSDAEVETIRFMERSKVFQTHMESEQPLSIGESVKVARGLLRGMAGHLLELPNGQALVGGGSFPKPVLMPLALLIPESGVK